MGIFKDDEFVNGVRVGSEQYCNMMIQHINSIAGTKLKMEQSTILKVNELAAEYSHSQILSGIDNYVKFYQGVKPKLKLGFILNTQSFDDYINNEFLENTKKSVKNSNGFKAELDGNAGFDDVEIEDAKSKFKDEPEPTSEDLLEARRIIYNHFAKPLRRPVSESDVIMAAHAHVGGVKYSLDGMEWSELEDRIDFYLKNTTSKNKQVIEAIKSRSFF